MQLDSLGGAEHAGIKPDQVAGEPRWKSYEIVRGKAETPILIVCDHATNVLPNGYGTLGLPVDQLERHIAYDIGALPVALEMGRQLGATVISSKFSRLLIDPNRGLDDPTLIMQLSDGAIIPGNVNVDDAEANRRIETCFRPYHAAVRSEISAMLARGVTPAIFSLHSYTDVWRGVLRRWHGAVLWDKDPRLAMPLLRELAARSNFEIGDNEPYSGRLKGNSIYEHGTLNGLPHVLFEIRQDLIREAEGQRAWASLLSECLTSIFSDPSTAGELATKRHYGSHTDQHGGERHSL